ncbi:Chitinase [[Actinomadura] parvosata subsp. kistnae]|nr:Chitinase [Actinomadura parvosata subsp. kistnae]
MRRLATPLIAVLVIIALCGLPAQAATRLVATFSLSGTTGTFVVSNPGTTAVTGWSIVFELPAGVTASSPQHATIRQSGTKVTLTPAYYIATLQPGRTTDPYSPKVTLSSPAQPVSCLIDGANCDGSGGDPPAKPPVTATYDVSGSAAKFVVANNGTTALSGWTIVFDLPAGVTASNAQHASLSQSGRTVTLTPAHYNTTVNAGATTEPYSPSFTVSTAGAEPTSCRINDVNCDGSPDAPPGAPGNLRSPARTTKTVTLAWDGATPGSLPITGYEVYQGSSLAASVTGTTAIVPGLSPSTAYTFTVKAKDRRGTLSPASAPLAVTTRNPADDTQPPTAPGDVRSTARTSSSITLTWSASSDNSGIASYDVFIGSSVAMTVSGTTAVVSGLVPSTEYAFTVRARDLYDNLSPASAVVKAATADIVETGYARVGYFVQWGIYGRQYFVRNLDTTGAAAKLTHINYAFANIDPQNLTCLQGVTKGTTTDPQDPNQGDGAGDAEADYGRPFSAAQSVDGVADTGWEKLRGNFNQLRKLKAKHPHLKVLISLGG